MHAEVLRVVGQVAGLGGLAIGMALLLFREIIQKEIFPRLTKEHAFQIIRLLVICTWSIALVGIGAWVYSAARQPPPSPHHPSDAGNIGAKPAEINITKSAPASDPSQDAKQRNMQEVVHNSDVQVDHTSSVTNKRRSNRAVKSRNLAMRTPHESDNARSDREVAQPKLGELQLVGAQVYLKKYGFSTVSIIDLNIKNAGETVENIMKIQLTTRDLFKYTYDPCPTCLRRVSDGIYNISFKRLLEGATEYVVSHVIEPGSIEQISLVLGGGDAPDGQCYVARIVVSLFAGSGPILMTSPLDVLVEHFDRGSEVPITAVAEDELRTLIDSGTTAPEVATPTVIRQHLRKARWPSWLKDELSNRAEPP